MKLVYKILYRLIEACELGSIVKDARVSVLRKIGQERFFKVTGSGIIDAKLVTPLSLLGNQMGFKVRVMFQNPRRPKGKKFQFDRRLVYGFATHNVGTAKKKKIEILNYMNEVDVNVLALQETKRTFRDGTWKVPDCTVFEYRPKKLSKGNLGIATIVKRDMFPEVLEITENMIWIRCGRGEKKLVICNVYIPTANADGKQEVVKAELKRRIKHYAGDGKSVNLLVMGDFNMTPSEVKDWIRGQQIPLEVAPMRKGEVTFKRGKKGSVIDYILHSTGKKATCSPASVQDTKISDHNGLSATVSFGRRKNTSGPLLKSINRFAVLRHLGDDLDDSKFTMGRYQGLEGGESSEDVSRFLAELKNSLEEKGMVRTPKLGKRVKKPFPRKIKRLAQKRRALLKKRHDGKELSEEEKSLMKKCQRAIRKYKEEERVREIRNGIQAQLQNDSRRLWQWIEKQLYQEKCRKAMVIKDPITGKLCTDEREVADLWASHYRMLGSKGEGHSKDASYWEEFEVRKPQNQGMCGSEEYWNADITWNEIQGVVKTMAKGKASGIDGIPGEVYRAITGREWPREGKGLACVLLYVLNTIFNGNIPEDLMTSTVVSVPKKGDLTDMNNYRGISLMPVCVKIVAAVIAQRISSAFEDEHFLSDAQAGFRPKQECVGQVGALLEIIQRWTTPTRELKNRRRLIGDELRAFACFIDFKKAYDMVPHETMLYKLRAYGISGKTYNFIRTLYDRSSISVRVGHLRSPKVPLERGLRQGCPLSLILFSIFINDILPRPRRPLYPWEPKVEGLMFADDIVVFARSAERLQELLNAVTEWANRWEMFVGHAKCGVMLFGAARNDANYREREWYLQGKPIAVVEEYTYLGVKITPDLDEVKMMGARIGKMEMVLGSQKRFLCNYRIPVPAQIRVMVLQSVVQTSGLYGAEVWGGNKRYARNVQAVLNKGMNYILQGTGNFSVCIPSLQLELDMPPVYPTLVAKRLRCMCTWVGRIVIRPRFWIVMVVLTLGRKVSWLVVRNWQGFCKLPSISDAPIMGFGRRSR